MNFIGKGNSIGGFAVFGEVISVGEIKSCISSAEDSYVEIFIVILTEEFDSHVL